jgi:hypothetical protein
MVRKRGVDLPNLAGLHLEVTKLPVGKLQSGGRLQKILHAETRTGHGN